MQNQNINKRIDNNNLESMNLGTISLPFKSRFYSQCSKLLSRFNIRTMPLLNNKLSSIIKLGKDITDKFKRTGVVHKFNCKSCDARYIGETKRELEVRIKEHKKSIIKNKDTVVASHIKNNSSHEFDWENVAILDCEKFFTKRRISEMLCISGFNNTINRKEDTLFLSSTYKSVCHYLQKLV